jgi:hypothetical protein
MASLGSLVVSLGMDTARFTSDTGKAARQMAKLTAEAGKIGFAIGTSIAVGLRSIGGLVTSSIDAADATAKLSRSVGMTTEELSKLTYAADLSGVAQQELGSSLAKLAKVAVDAAGGGKQGAEAFDAIGVSVRDANGAVKPMSGLLEEIADKFASYEDGATKTALAQEFFGKSGAKLIPLLNNGSKGLADLTAEADRLGLTLTDSAGKSAEQFNDNLTRLKKSGEGLGLQIAQRLLPLMETLTNSLFSSANGANAFGRAAEVAATGVKLLVSAGAVIVGVFKTVGETLGGIGAAVVALMSGEFKRAYDIASMTGADFIGNIRNTVGTVNSVWNDAASDAKSNAPKLGAGLAAPVINAAGIVAKNAKAIKDSLQKAYDDVEKQVSGILRSVQTLGMSDTQVQLFDLSAAGASPEQLARAEAYLKTLEMYRTQQDDIAAAVEARTRAETDGQAVYEATRSPLEALTKQLSEYQALLDQGVISWDTYARATDAAQVAFDGISAKAEEGKSLAEELGLTFTSAFEDAIVNGGKLSDVIGGLEQDMIRLITRKMVTEPLTNALSGALGGGGGIFGSLLGSIFGGSRAMGGDMLPGHKYLVGENGPEVVSTGSDRGTVTPMGGTTVNNVFHLAQPADRRTQQQIAAKAGQSIQRSIQRGT